MQKPKVIVILGPTATGKSDLAVKIALKYKGEVISADSRQVYKDLNIGTGKITKKEMRGVPHYLLDVVNPKIKFTVTEYQKKAIYAMAEIIKKNKVPIICGGTGFYIDAITKGVVFPEVPPNLKLRKVLEKKSTIELLRILQKIEQNRAKDILNKNEQNNKVRIIRAIEIVKTLGSVPDITEVKPQYEFIKIGLFLSQDKYKYKIRKRVQGMFKNGLLKEINKLKKKGVPKKRLKEFGFEYDEPTEEKVVKETLKYVKRQMTWFKRDKTIKWFDASEKDLEKRILLKLKKDF